MSMKYCCSLLAFILCYWLNAMAADGDHSTDSCARFEIQGQYLCDVGDVFSDTDSVSSSFWLKSTGDVPLIIVSSTTSCPCVCVSYDRDIVYPGDSVEIKMTYYIRSHVGMFKQSVLLKTNTVPHDYVWFYLHGNVLKEPANTRNKKKQ